MGHLSGGWGTSHIDPLGTYQVGGKLINRWGAYQVGGENHQVVGNSFGRWVTHLVCGELSSKIGYLSRCGIYQLGWEVTR